MHGTNQNIGTASKGSRHESCHVTFGASGAPTLVDSGKGNFFTAVAKTATGRYTFTLSTPYPRKVIALVPTLSCVSVGGVLQQVRYVEGSYSYTAGTFEVDVTAVTGTSIPAAATGLITCATKANLADTDYITIPDGINPATVYEFDTAGDGVTGGRVQVNVSSDTTAAQVAARLRTAILANQPALSVTDNADGTLTLAHRVPGTIGNNTITENVAHASFTVSGLSGGSAGAVTAQAAADPTSGTSMQVQIDFQGYTNL